MVASRTREVLPVEPVTQLCKALGDDTRLRMVALLAHGELCVCHLQAALGLSQPTASRQLSVLRAGGVVAARRDGSWIYYRLAAQTDPTRRRLLRSVVAGFAKQPGLRRDVDEVRRALGPGACR
jgi:ArsR family transcriptional regulator